MSIYIYVYIYILYLHDIAMSYHHESEKWSQPPDKRVPSKLCGSEHRSTNVDLNPEDICIYIYIYMYNCIYEYIYIYIIQKKQKVYMYYVYQKYNHMTPKDIFPSSIRLIVPYISNPAMGASSWWSRYRRSRASSPPPDSWPGSCGAWLHHQFGMVETLSGWWLGHPSEKYERQLGWLETQYMGK